MLLVAGTCVRANCSDTTESKNSNGTVDLILINGVVITVDEKNPKGEAVAIKGDRILKIGDMAEILKLKTAGTRVIDLDGQLVVPGFIESHAHLTGVGRMLTQLDLTQDTSWTDIVRKVEAAAKKAKPGEWILGRGWHQSLWKQKPVPDFDGYPIHDQLSKVSPNNPVLLTHRSGHMSFANLSAMRAAGVSSGTVAPEGGEVPRNKKGEPIGVFRETAQGLVSRALSKSRENMTRAALVNEYNRYVELAQQECFRYGITTFCDAGISTNEVLQLKNLIDRDQLDLRVWVMLRGSNQQLVKTIPQVKKLKGYGGHRLDVGGIKQMVDGALGAHGAWLLEPYSDLPSSTGLVVTPIETIRQTAEIAFSNDLQLCVHAIGDRANREMLDLFESFYQKAGDRKLRWRIEHAQHLSLEDIPRFGKLGVIASMQGIHCTSDGPFVPNRLGEKRSQDGAYVWQSLLSSSAVIANGSDAPVEPLNPILGFYSTVTRKMKNGEVFYGEQKLSRMEALKSYTLDAAYAIGQEKNRGSIMTGKLADLVVLSKNILSVPDDQVCDAKVNMTIVGGEVVYQAKK